MREERSQTLSSKFDFSSLITEETLSILSTLIVEAILKNTTWCKLHKGTKGFWPMGSNAYIKWMMKTDKCSYRSISLLSVPDTFLLIKLWSQRFLSITSITHLSHLSPCLTFSPTILVTHVIVFIQEKSFYRTLMVKMAED